VTESEAAAKRASLRYVNDGMAGISRRKRGTGFVYHDTTGQRIRDAKTIERIRSLVIPPAWSDVWISPTEAGHIQATGRDARRRKQYRYHTRWRAARDETKYERLAAFGLALPRLRAAVNADLQRDGLPREKVLAVVIRLLETTYIRVGNEEYARTNGSFGLTTLRNRHVSLRGDTMRFTFTGKSGQPHNIRLSDRRLARTVKQVRDLPGQLLFQYVDTLGDVRAVDSADVNEYIRTHAGASFTAKDFRTWAGTLLAGEQLASIVEGEEPINAKALVGAVKAVAAQLGNTPAVCRQQYIHPLVLRAFAEKRLRQRWLRANARPRVARGLTRQERSLLRFLAENERT
jgi:DNA topoisomerase-1